MRRWMVVVLLVVLGITLFVGCTDEELAKIKAGAKKGGEVAQTAAPWLPPPFDLIAYAIGGLGSAVGAAIALKQKRRATEATRIAALEREAKEMVTNGIRAFTTGIDKLRTSNDPHVKEKVEAFLGEWKKFKLAAEPWLKDGLLLVDTVRKTPVDMPR